MADLPKTPKPLRGLDPDRAGTFLPREGARRAYKPQGLARLIPKVTRKIAGKRPTLISDLQGEWIHIVGEDLARFTRPASLKAQVLHLDVALGAGPVIAMQQDLMLSRINTHLGAGKVKRLSLRQVDFLLSEIEAVRAPQDYVNHNPDPLTQAQSPLNDGTRVGSALENLRAKLERRTRTPTSAQGMKTIHGAKTTVPGAKQETKETDL